MTLPDPSPLTAEEQALAQRLARLHPHMEPSPALDARVLAAAHAAAQSPAVDAPLRRRRWPAMLGLAASLVLAIGISWRLRPQPEPPAAPHREAAVANRIEVRPLQKVAVPLPAPTPDTIHPAPRSDREPVAAQASVREAPPRTTVITAPASAVEAPAAPPEPTRIDTPTPMALPPPPPPAALRDSAARAAFPAPAAPPVAQDAQDDGGSANEAARADTSSDPHGSDEPSDDVPPATVESPAVRDAWLERIHGLVEAGDIAGARASLREFMRRYPDYTLPEDLRALAR